MASQAYPERKGGKQLAHIAYASSVLPRLQIEFK